MIKKRDVVAGLSVIVGFVVLAFHGLYYTKSDMIIMLSMIFIGFLPGLIHLFTTIQELARGNSQRIDLDKKGDEIVWFIAKVAYWVFVINVGIGINALPMSVGDKLKGFVIITIFFGIIGVLICAIIEFIGNVYSFILKKREGKNKK